MSIRKRRFGTRVNNNKSIEIPVVFSTDVPSMDDLSEKEVCLPQDPDKKNWRNAKMSEDKNFHQNEHAKANKVKPCPPCPPCPPPCAGADENCAECCDILNNRSLRKKLGVARPDSDSVCSCHDICVEEVRYVCATNVDCQLSVPGIDGGPTGCRGERLIISPNHDCKLVVTCAEEYLRNDCKAVIMKVGVQLILGSKECRLVLNRILEFTCDTFYSFPDGSCVTGNALSDAMKKIDGSCMVIDLYCKVVPSDGTNPNPSIRICGTIVDKLWKHENIWVTGLRPYKGITVKSEFGEPHKIGPCGEMPEECLACK